MNDINPIGVFDSGVGGLSVLHQIRKLLPHEDLHYIADSAHAPYGTKSREIVEQRSIMLSRFFMEKNVKAVVVACNTATAVAISTLRSIFTLPIIGMEPAVKPAAEMTRAGIIGVLATERTLESRKFTILIERFAADSKVIEQPCPGLVELVEKGKLSGDKTRATVKKYLCPLLERGADTIVLGCTHYPFLIPIIREITGPDISIIDTGAPVSLELRRRLKNENILSKNDSLGEEIFWTSGPQTEARKLISRLWNNSVNVQPLPEIYASHDMYLGFMNDQ